MIEVRQSRQDRETARIKTSYQASQSAPVFNSGPVTVPDIHLGMCCHLKTWDGNKHERVKALTAQGNILFSGVSGHDGASIIICFCDGYA